MQCTKCNKERAAAFSHNCGARLCRECYSLCRIDYHDYGRGHVRHGELCYKCCQVIWPIKKMKLR